MVAKTTDIPYLRNSQVYKLSIVSLFITQVYLFKKSHPLYSAQTSLKLFPRPSQMVLAGSQAVPFLTPAYFIDVWFFSVNYPEQREALQVVPPGRVACAVEFSWTILHLTKFNRVI